MSKSFTITSPSGATLKTKNKYMDDDVAIQVDGAENINANNIKSGVSILGVSGNMATVVANPTLVGGESDLTSVEIEGTKYAIPSGTEVTANPTLDGNETALSGLEVEGVKYSVGGGGGSEVHLYKHHILLGGYASTLDSYPLYVAFDIYLSTDTPLTFNGIISWLHGNGYNIGKHLFTVVSDESPAPLENVDTHIIIGIYAQSTRIYTQIQYVDGVNVGKLGGGFINSSQTCEDTITQIF